MVRNLLLGILLLFCHFTLSAQQDMGLYIMQGGLPYQETSWRAVGSGEPLPKEWIKEMWDDDYHIISAAHTHQGWFVCMCRNSGYTGQSYYFSGEWPKDWLAEKNNDGYFITSIASNHSYWFFVVSQNSGYTSQLYATCKSSEVYGTMMLEAWPQGYFITQATYTGEKWLLILSKGSGITEQQYYFVPTRSLLDKYAEEAWGQGYNISLLEHGDGMYFMVASKNSSVSPDISQSYQVLRETSPKEFIQSRWEKGMDLLYVGGGYAGEVSSAQSGEWVISATSKSDVEEFKFPSSSYAHYTMENGKIQVGDNVYGKYRISFDASKRGFGATDSLPDGSELWHHDIRYIDAEATITKDDKGETLLIQLGDNILIQADGYVWLPDASEKGKGRIFDCNVYESVMMEFFPYFSEYPDEELNKERMINLEKALRQHGYRITYEVGE